MKRILIYGDSNVWGDNLLTGRRISYEKQWVHILKQYFDNDIIIFQEGLPGRIAGNYLLDFPYKNGLDSFLSIMKSHSPLDIIIIALGTNDLNVFYHRTAKELFDDLYSYYYLVEEDYNNPRYHDKYYDSFPKFLYVLPPTLSLSSDMFNDESRKVRMDVLSYFNHIHIPYLIDDQFTFSDEIHLDEKGHERMAKLVYEKLKDL